VGVDAEVDTRDFAGSPTRGWLVRGGTGWYREAGGDDAYGFWKTRADVSTYVHFAYRRVVELRAAGEFTEQEGHRVAPFYYLSKLGSYETIRGFSNGRFRDANAVLASLEYRWPVRRGTDATLFVDAGNVYDKTDNFRRKYIQVGWGGGFRFYNRNGLIATVEAGKSRDEWRFYFVLN
jgi:outer membrane protein assembly factor BamA